MNKKINIKKTSFICPYMSYIGFNNLILENLINIYYE